MVEIEELTVAEQLTSEARTLADASGSNLIRVGQIMREFKRETALFRALGYPSFEKWVTGTFGKRAKAAHNALRIVKKLGDDYPHDQLLTLGTVKCLALLKLPESLRRDAEWQRALKEDDATTFAHRVKAHIGKSDHREEFCMIPIEAPKSFRDETFRRVLAMGKAVEGDVEDWQIVEAMTANYEQEILQHPEAIRACEQYIIEREKRIGATQ